jgi:hypothetical protein
MKIYDCFTFFNEFDLLEIRLAELWDTVDHFVIAEANQSYSGKSKEFLLLDNWSRFSAYTDKIRHVAVSDMPATDSWARERHQRCCLNRGLYDSQPEDLIITSDCDEIPRAEALRMIAADTNNYSRYQLAYPMFQYKINYMKIHDIVKQSNIMVTRNRVYTNPQQERAYTFPWIQTPADTVTIDHAGWHFSYFGDDRNAITKIENFAHTETNIPEIVDNHSIDRMIHHRCGHHGPAHPERFEIVQIDDYFPNTITEKLDYWRSRGRVVDSATHTVADFYN